MKSLYEELNENYIEVRDVKVQMLITLIEIIKQAFGDKR